MATDHAATIVDHIRSVMGNSDWRFHGPGIERIVCKAIDKARSDAIKEHIESEKELLREANDPLAKLQDQIVEERAAKLSQERQ